MRTTSTKRCVFESEETAILKAAYELAAAKLTAHYHVDARSLARLARIVFKIGRERGRNGERIRTAADVDSVASDAMVRLLAMTVREGSPFLVPPS
jgi:hypothetical protein